MPAGFAEFEDILILEGDVGGEKFVKALGLGKRRGEQPRTVLIKNGGLGILEENVGIGIAAIKFLFDLFGEVVAGVFAFPKALVNAENIFQRAVRPDGFVTAGIEIIEFLDEQQIARAGVGIDEIEDGPADGCFLGAAAEADDAVHFRAVGVDGAKVCHVRSRIARRAAVAKTGVERSKFFLLTPALSSFGEAREKRRGLQMCAAIMSQRVNLFPSPRPNGERVRVRGHVAA